MPTPSTVLIVEDDADIAALIARYLEKSGYRTETASDGARGLARVREALPDLVILDLMLPGLNGLEICRAVRADDKTAALPIIMLTARGEEADRILGLDVGADDYIVKPFSPSELMARVRALLRRTAAPPGKERQLRCGPILVDLERHTVSSDGADVRLTAKEFLLLQYFIEHHGRVVSRDRLLSDVWDYQYPGVAIIM